MKRRIRRVLAVLMVITLLLSSMGAAASAISNIDNNQLLSSLNNAKTFIDALTINNSSNVPSKVVSTYGTHFTWDNEKKETSNGSIFEWAYYNGLVIEGIYSDDSVSQIHSGYTLNTYKADHIGNKNVTVSYDGFTASFKINTAFDLISFIRSLFKF